MIETSTFSAIVDDVRARSQRKDRIRDIVSYARATIRECQVQAYFEQDLKEAVLVADQVPFHWPRPLRLRALLAVKPNSILDRRQNAIWFDNKPPGAYKYGDKYFYYLSGSTFIFGGDELQASQQIDLAYFEYARKFIYYQDEAARPARFDPELEIWVYAAEFDVDDTTREHARDLVTNWLLINWYDTILEGTLAKIFKAINDPRSRMAFSLYKSQQLDILKGERAIAVTDHDANG